MRATNSIKLSDVAKLAQVSSSAAGKVLNGGSDTIRVSAVSRQRILAAARQLGYRPNMAASILAGGSSKLVGILIDSTISYRYFRLLQEVEKVCKAKGYRLMTSFTHDSIQDMYENYQMMHRYGIRGIICCAHDYPHYKEEFIRTFSDAEDMVCVEKPFCPNMPHVVTDRTKALTDLYAKALQDGYRRIGILCGSTLWHTEKTLIEEFVKAQEANRRIPDSNLVFIAQEEPQLSLTETVRDIIQTQIIPAKPDFIYVDDAPHAAALQTQLNLTNRHVTLYGGDQDPMFEALGIPSLNPHYDQIALYLVEKALGEMDATTPCVIQCTL